MATAHTENISNTEVQDSNLTTASEKPAVDSQIDLNHPSNSTSNDPDTVQHGSLERVSTAKDEGNGNPAARTVTSTSAAAPVHSVFTKNQKRFIVSMASWAGFFSPVSGNIYFPALNSLASDLRVSNTLINLTLTSYMIFQGLAPAFIGDLADVAGRRPAYVTCFVLYILANIGLALQNSYVALFLLRCLQSSGSSGTIALSSGVVADIATAAQRGSYMGFVTAGALLGPAIGPVLGGVLAQFLGWRAIFWFLAIFGAAFIVVFMIFFPETARTAVGNGSIPPRGLNMSLMNYLAVRRARQQCLSQDNSESSQPSGPDQTPTTSHPKQKLRFPNPLSSIHILFDAENLLLLLYNGLTFCVFYDITVAIPSIYAANYGFNDLQIGLCYLPFGIGSCSAALSNGQLLDRNFRRWCGKLGFTIKRGRQQELRDFPIERARLEVGLPCCYVAALLIIVYGWVLEINGPLAPILVLLFFISFFMTASFNVTSTMLVDFYPLSPATATAANNLTRCLLGAGATAAIVPLINVIGKGWSYTLLGLLLIGTSPMLWYVYFRGKDMREKRRLRDEKARLKKESRKRRNKDVEVGDSGESLDANVTSSTAVGETVGRGDIGQDSNSPFEKARQKRPDENGGHHLHRLFSQESGF